MKLENVQIEIKNKEHYEAVKKRLEELIKDNGLDFFEICAKKHDYKIVIYIHNNKLGGWGKSCDGFIKSMKVITLDDLYEVEKEKAIKERFEVISEFASTRIIKIYDTHQECMDFIKKQTAGRYKIKKYYEVVEE